MPEPPLRIAPPPETDDLSPEHAFVAAFLGAALREACSRAQASRYDAGRIARARAWLQDRDAVLWWLGLIDLGEPAYARMLRVAGLEEP
jgi:hypothetical protein